jgi:hypothetical protein
VRADMNDQDSHYVEKLVEIKIRSIEDEKEMKNYIKYMKLLQISVIVITAFILGAFVGEIFL